MKFFRIVPSTYIKIKKFLIFSICKTKTWLLKLVILELFVRSNFSNFPNCKFLEFSKLTVFGTFLIGNFWNFPNYKINKFLDFFQFAKPKFDSKNWQLWNCSSIQHSAPLAISCQFLYLPFDINQFSQLLFPISVIRKFGRSTFELRNVRHSNTSLLELFTLIQNILPSSILSRTLRFEIVVHICKYIWDQLKNKHLVDEKLFYFFVFFFLFKLKTYKLQ